MPHTLDVAAIRAQFPALSRTVRDRPAVFLDNPGGTQVPHAVVEAMTEYRDVAAALGEQGVFVWDGNYYALAVTERLGLEERGGMVRVGAVHYNTESEIERLGAVLRTMAISRYARNGLAGPAELPLG